MVLWIDFHVKKPGIASLLTKSNTCPTLVQSTNIMPDKIPHIRHTANGRRAWTHIGDMQLITSSLCPAGLNKLIRDDISTAI
jgi:hypothetical protein